MNALDAFGVTHRIPAKGGKTGSAASVASKAISTAAKLAKVKSKKNGPLAQKIAAKLKKAGTNLQKRAGTLDKAASNVAKMKPPSAKAASSLHALPSAKVHDKIPSLAARTVAPTPTAKPSVPSRAAVRPQAAPAPQALKNAVRQSAPTRLVRGVKTLLGAQPIPPGNLQQPSGGGGMQAAIDQMIAGLQAYTAALDTFTQACGMLASLLVALDAVTDQTQNAAGQDIASQLNDIATAFPEDFGGRADVDAAAQAMSGVPNLISQGNAWLQTNTGKTVVSTVQNPDGSMTITNSDGTTTTVDADGNVSSGTTTTPPGGTPQPPTPTTTPPPTPTTPDASTTQQPMGDTGGGFGGSDYGGGGDSGGGPGIIPDMPMDQGYGQMALDPYAQQQGVDDGGGFADFGVQSPFDVEGIQSDAQDAVDLLLSGGETADNENYDDAATDDTDSGDDSGDEDPFGNDTDPGDDNVGFSNFGVEDVLGLYDLGSATKQMDSLKVMPLGVAQIFLQHGLDAIERAIENAKKFDLPGDTNRSEVQAHLQWHQTVLAGSLAQNIGDLSVPYANADDLKKYVLMAYTEENATEEGAKAKGETLSKAWGDYADMWIEAGKFIASLPPKALEKVGEAAKAIRSAAADAAGGFISDVTGLPVWAWALIGVGVVGVLGLVAWAILNSKAGAAASGAIVKRYVG